MGIEGPRKTQMTELEKLELEARLANQSEAWAKEELDKAQRKIIAAQTAIIEFKARQKNDVGNVPDPDVDHNSPGNGD